MHPEALGVSRIGRIGRQLVSAREIIADVILHHLEDVFRYLLQILAQLVYLGLQLGLQLG
jgi:hypothetical protein